jgi:hypothetical protein
MVLSIKKGFMSINIKKDSFALHVKLLTKENIDEYDDIYLQLGSFINVTFSYENSGFKCSMSISDEESLNEITADNWLKLTKKSTSLNFGAVYGSHVDNGEVSISSNLEDNQITFKVDGARGGINEFSVPVSECGWAFQKLSEVKGYFT